MTSKVRFPIKVIWLRKELVRTRVIINPPPPPTLPHPHTHTRNRKLEILFN